MSFSRAHVRSHLSQAHPLVAFSCEGRSRMAGSSADLEAALTRATLLTGEVFDLTSRVVDSALAASAAADVDMEEASVVGGEDEDVQMNEGELPAGDKAPEAPPPEAGGKVPEVPPPGLGGEDPENKEEKEKSTVVEP